MPSLLVLLGVRDPGKALSQALAAAGAEVAPGPADLGDLLDVQLSAEVTLDAYTWSPYQGGIAVRYQPGGDGGLDPVVPRALSAVTGGLVLGMEAVRTRDRYAVGAFLSGRTVELERCIEGVASSPAARELCTEDAVEDTFAAWLAQVTGAPVQALSGVGAEAVGAVLATPVDETADAEESALTRLAHLRRDGALQVLEHPGELVVAEVIGEIADRPSVGLELRGAGAPTRWVIATADGVVQEGEASGQSALADAVPAWALAAPR